MKFWLIFMLFTNKGEYIDKIEAEYQSFGSCAVAAGMLTSGFVNSSVKTQAYCVTDDHYNGVKQDEGIPYDTIEEEDVIGDIIAELP
jgi:hypothetical protein